MASNKIKFITDLKLQDEINAHGQLLSFNPGDVIVQPGKYIKVVPLLIRGTVRVSRVDELGNEIFIYYIKEGQSCAVSLSTCLTDKISTIKAVVEEDTELIIIPTDVVKKWFEEFQNWRLFVLNTMENRFDELLKTVDQIAFLKTEDRLAAFLKKKSVALNTKTIIVTHQEIASELSTSREVISRLLKHLEKLGKLKLFRNKIELNALL